MTKYTFPENFFFGAATAAYQAEGATDIGGKGKVAWDEMYHRESSTFHADQASNFYYQYEEDLRLAKEHGVNAIRISIAWSRIIPNGIGEVSPEGIAFYHRLIDACLLHGVEPFVTLHHFDTPLHLFHQGDWLNRAQIDAFVRYAEVCFSEYGDKVSYWITINEPWSIVAGQYIIGHFPPEIHYDIPKAVQAMHHMMLAHAKVVLTYKRMNFNGKIGIVHILESKYARNLDNPLDVLAAKREDVLANQFLLDASFLGVYSNQTLDHINHILDAYGSYRLIFASDDFDILTQAAQYTDFMGINYYASHFIQHYEGDSLIIHNGTGSKGSARYANKGVGERVTHPDVPTTDWDWPIYPEGLYDMLIRIQHDYPHIKEIFVTENGIGAKDIINDNQEIIDDYRIDYVSKHLQAISRAQGKGVPVRGYFMWSLIDLLSWTNGFNKRYGFFYVDFETQKRHAKKSAHWWRDLSISKTIQEDLL
ncbi:6-phospho-beta-galactosidase (plasmid) [Entomospira nematocerorum]|uniref:6-phospho-beta-galactosidase n=1 Tax=Entomospira nematocerorum TaxID=2719987 RepID=A0A968GD86_9SPIO|nr:6-phospho-beta-galactosidase [Entomospira nematocera]NIZ47707.1 6-phospho-beta-galactosidase [Entomospira nematocera]WDI34681.1 6-phospho-beta-galactosidase [Entomospira nematocera]